MNMSRWDEYFLSICETVASNSKCLSRAVGAIIVNDKSIISTGYNGPPRGIPACGSRYFIDEKLRETLNFGFNVDNYPETVCPRQTLGFKSGQGLEWCIAGHAERNSIVNAAREGIKVKGAIMYMGCEVPCTPCLVEIINAGISEIVVTGMGHYDTMSEYLIKESKLKVRTYNI